MAIFEKTIRNKNFDTLLRKLEQKILNRMPLHAYGDTRDLGKMAEFLVGDGAAYITGQDFAVDGGALAFGY